MSRPVPRHRLAAGLIVAFAVASLGGSTPEIVPVRVPASRVATWFPAGTNIRVLTPERFEELTKAIRASRGQPGPPRVIKAMHSARWAAGSLSGRSEWTIDRSRATEPSGLISLEPWSPALVGSPGSRRWARSSAEGRLGLQVDATTPASLAFDWQLRATEGSHGQVFDLELPEIAISGLSLDLPAGMVPEADSGTRVAPSPGSPAGRTTWKFEGARGRLRLKLGTPGDLADRPDGPTNWLEGPTRIDLGATSANWIGEWRLASSPGAPDRLAIDLDPGLDLIDLAGPRVTSFRVEGRPPGSRVLVELSPPGPEPATAFVVRAQCRAPAEGTWTIPGARPSGAIWTAGRVSVRVDPSRILQDCIERSGRRVLGGDDQPGGASALVFEPLRVDGPIADLSFRMPSADAAVAIRGCFRIGPDRPSIDVALTWTVDRGPLLMHDVDLAPGWEPDRVVSAEGEPVPWHAEVLSRGGIRVHASPAAIDTEGRASSLILSASRDRPGPGGSIDLPRVRPAPGSGKAIEEIWVTPRVPGFSVRPIQGRGLAWIDPPTSPSTPDRPVPWPADGLMGALAWRWIGDESEGRVERRQIQPGPRIRVGLDAKIAGSRLGLDGSIAIEPDGSGLGSLPVHLDADVATAPDWHPVDPAGPGVEVRPLTPAERLAAGFPARGSAWNLAFSSAPARAFAIAGRIETPWSGTGPIPLLTVPARFRPAGLLAVEVEEADLCRLDVVGLARIDRAGTRPGPEPGAESSPAEAGPRLRRVGLFEYGPEGGKVVATTETRPPGVAGGLVREATLVSQVFDGSGHRHRLVLDIHPDAARSVELSLPAGLILDRARRDGQPVAPIPLGRAIRIDLPSPTLARPSSLLTIDYRIQDGAEAAPLRLGSILPGCSMPCVSFVWEVSTPRSWDVRDESDDLVASDPNADRPWLERLLGTARIGRPADRGASEVIDREAALRDLERFAEQVKDGGESLGDWFLRLDAGRRPLVIDRLSLQAAGLGPGTLRASPTTTARPGTPVVAALAALDLEAVPVGPAILITTTEGATEPARAGSMGRGRWLDRVRRAVAEGTDGSDRFQSADRWRGETTPRAPQAGEGPDRTRAGAGWQVSRFTSTGWPDGSGRLVVADRAAGKVRGWLLTLLIVVVAGLAGDRPWRGRGIGLAMTLAIAATGFSATWPEPSATAQGLLRGALGALGFWSLRATWLGRRPVGWGTFVSRLPGWRSRSVPGALLALVAGIGLAGPGLAEGPGADRPILALFPEPDGSAASPASPRVLMRLEDHDRLVALGEATRPTPGDRALAISAQHRIDREGRDMATVVSRYQVEVAGGGDGPAAWAMPMGRSLDLSATVDDRPVPLAIDVAAGLASVSLPGPGPHSVEFRRGVRIEPSGIEGERVRVAINRAAFARASIGRDPKSRPAELPGAAGQVDVRGDRVEGLIGPLATLEARWQLDGSPVREPTPGNVEASVLWDALPLGDLARVRLVHSGPLPLASIEIEVEPGVLVRRLAVPGSSTVRLAGTPDHPAWIVRADPPLPRGVPFELELWRGLTNLGGPRVLPGFRLGGAGHLAGAVGLRKPPGWSGRLAAEGDADPAEGRAFQARWADAIGTGLVWAGSAPFDQANRPAPTISPPILRRSVQGRLACELGPGRLVATLEATLSDLEGRSFAVELGFPTDFRITLVRADGLADWRRSARDRIRLQFDGSIARDRRIRLEGFVPAPADSALTESRSFLARIPWPRWFGVDAEAGELTLSCPNRFSYEPATRDATRLTPGPDSGLGYRASYRVDRPEGLGLVQWTSPTALVGVSVRSELIARQTGLTWAAEVNCEVSGGPAESLHWRLPSEWADGATLELDGIACRPVADRRGEATFWTITPAAPIWGHARLVLRANRPIAVGTDLAYPEIAPLSATGRGTLDRYELAIANLTGRPLEVAGTAGLQPIDAARFRAGPTVAPPGSIDRAYLVTGDHWSLRVRLGDEGGAPSGSGGESPASVGFADFCATIAADRSTWGCASLGLGRTRGAFLAFTLPGASQVPWAVVDGARMSASVGPGGRWSIPLGDRGARRVEFCWTTPASSGSGPAVLPLPALDQQGVPVSIRTFAPASAVFETRSGAVTSLDRADWSLRSARTMAGRIAATMADFERGSSFARKGLVDDLVRFELEGRAIDRSSATPVAAEASPGLRFASLRASVEDEGREGGLDDVIEEAKTLVGTSSSPSAPVATRPDDASKSIRVRQIGEARSYQAWSPGGGRPLDIQVFDAPRGGGWARAGFGAVAGCFVLVAGLLGLASIRDRRRGP